MEPEALEKRIPEIIEGLRLVMDPTFTFEKAVQRHSENAERANINHETISTKIEF